MKLLGLFLIHCVFTKKTESAKVRHSGRQKFVKTGTGKNKGFPEHCALCTYLGSMIPCDVRWRHRIQIDCTCQTYGAPYFDVDRSLSMNLGMSSCKVKNIFLDSVILEHLSYGVIGRNVWQHSVCHSKLPVIPK